MDLSQFQAINWLTSQYSEADAKRLRAPIVNGRHYWAVMASKLPPGPTLGVRVLESGICATKIEAVTKARTTARHWQQEHHKALGSTRRDFSA